MPKGAKWMETHGTRRKLPQPLRFALQLRTSHPVGETFCMGEKQQADLTFSSEPVICSFGCACSLTHGEKKQYLNRITYLFMSSMIALHFEFISVC